MVGTPRSGGCSTCRKRKKKCGEERPACLACVAAGWKCPGYTRSWKFVDESSQLSKHYASKDYGFDHDDIVSRGAAQSRIFLHKAHEAHEIVVSKLGILRVRVFWSPSAAPGERLGSMLCNILTDSTSQRVFQLQSLSNFFQFVPSRLGHNAALDASISCLCSIFTNFLNERTAVSRTTLKHYSRSIRALQSCLESQDVRSDSKTICASIILQLCELMTCEDTGRWDTLSRGSQALIQECGPKGFQSPFERALLESQRAFFIVHNMAVGQPCFLAEQKWRDVLALPDPSLTPSSRSIALRSELCDYLVEIPGLISETTMLLSEGPPTSSSAGLDDPKQILRLRNNVFGLSEQLKRWYECNFGSCSSLISKTATIGTLGAEKGTRDDKHPEATLFWVVNCVTNAVLVKLEQLLFALDSLVSDKEDIKQRFRFESYLEHQRLARKALDAVRGRSHLAAKPLVFGLSQLWSGDDGVESLLESKMSLAPE